MTKRDTVAALQALRDTAWQEYLAFAKKEDQTDPGHDLGHACFLIASGQMGSRLMTNDIVAALQMRGEIAGVDRALKMVRGLGVRTAKAWGNGRPRKS